MERERFIATEYAQKINSCKDRLFKVYANYGYEEEVQDIKKQLSKISEEQMIRVVFIGQYTAGKSSIISALTGNATIKIDSDIATDMASDYNWSGGVVLTDTPGLYTENPDHDRRTIEMIRQSDLLVYCITSDLFNQYTKADFEKWAFEINYSGKMFLVVNKMSKESGDYSILMENYSKTINRSLSPHSISEFPCAFVDAKDYRDGINDNNAELIAFSHFEEFITQLNNFIAQKGQLGKLDTPIQILKSSIDKVSEQSMDSEQDRAYVLLLSRIEKKVDQRRGQVNADIHNCIRRGLRPIIDKGYELSRSIGVESIDFTEEDFNELVESACEDLNRNLSDIIDSNLKALNDDISKIMDSETAAFFFNSVGGAVSEKKHLFESKRARVSRAQFEAISSVISQITGETVKLATKGGSASAGFLIKASEVSGSQLHNAVKFIGGKIGYKFHPWEAVNIAKNIGNVAKFAGPVISVFSFLFDVKETIDEAEQNERIAREQVKYRQSFVDVANDLEKQYIEHTNGIFAVYKSITDEIAGNRTKVQQMLADHNSMAKELVTLKSDLISIQTAIF
ncbi:MAG: hypothetical protein HDT33_08685 [Clostridiales bacterium]|nr:hypothetical protein [Clostridiales bacterium]